MARTRINLRIDPELWAWVQQQVTPERTATSMVEDGLRVLRSTGASPAAVVPVQGPGRAAAFRDAAARRKK